MNEAANTEQDVSQKNLKATKRPNAVRRFFSVLGPGLITGAADDDPSGVATYSITGAQLGTSLLWTAMLTWPLMTIVQMTCARIGMVTGLGLAGALRKRFPNWVLVGVAVALVIANTINVGADLAGMADAGQMLTGINSHVWVVFFGLAIAAATILFRYQQIAGILKWLALALFAYVFAAFSLRPHWGSVLHDTFIPSWPKGHDAWENLVAILGTTISPYLFFWQASQEVEEEKSMGRRMLAQRKGATESEIRDRKLDVSVGAFFSNLVMYFIILTTALTLHAHGLKNIETSKQAAEALKPIAGEFASMLYTLGIVGVGLLAIPTLTGSAAYACAETFGLRQGLDRSFKSAPAFYSIILVSTLVGIGFDFAHLNPVKMLFLTAVINGLLAPVLLIGILLVASDRKLMQNQPSSITSRLILGMTTALMLLAGVAMFVL